MGFESLEIDKHLEGIEGKLKKGALFQLIFGGKMKDLVDKISSLVNGVFKSETTETTTIVPDANQPNTPAESHDFNNNRGVDRSVYILGDMTNLAGQYPNEARAKNNNPSGITRPMSKTLRAELDNAGVRYSLGSFRPANEGGHYVKFATMDEGLKAKKIVLTKGDLVIRERLAKRVGTKNVRSNYEYADKIIAAAHIDGSKRFSQLSDDEMDRLMMMQIKQESGGLYRELAARQITPIEDNIA